LSKLCKNSQIRIIVKESVEIADKTPVWIPICFGPHTFLFLPESSVISTVLYAIFTFRFIKNHQYDKNHFDNAAMHLILC